MRRQLVLESLEAREVPAVYYVAPTGSNGNAGSSDAPWLTLQHAADTVRAGDQVVVRAGSYVGFNLTTDGTAAAAIRFTAEAGARISSPNPTGFQAGKDGINVEGADYVVIEGFNTSGMPRAGIRMVANTGGVIRNNTADSNGRWGIFTAFAENVTVENNVTSRSLAEHGIYVSNSADNPVVRGNTSWGNAACGIHMNSDLSAGGDGIITGALIENNVVHGNGLPNGGSGINMDGVSNSRVQNNLLYNNHAGGIALYSIDGAQGAMNNVIANNTVVQAADGRWALLIVNGSTGNTVFNNILWHNGTFRGSLSISADSLPGLKCDYNVVMDRFTLDDGASRLTLAQWRSQTGQDAHSLIAAPSALFANAAANDYHLSATSPALNAGAAALNTKAAPARDRDGAARPSGGAYDIGAFEVQQGSSGNPPTANPDSYTVAHDRTLTVPPSGVLANDTSDPAGRALTAALVAGPAHGTLTLNADGSFTYRPTAGYVGPDSFTYAARDGSAASDPATVSLSVTNRAPVPADDAYQLSWGKALTVPAAVGVLANDADADADALTAALVTGPAHGTLTLNPDGSFTYRPTAGYIGPDGFTYRARDGVAGSDPATVSLAVTNQAPVARDDSYQVARDKALTVAAAGLLANDSDADGNPLTAALAAGPANGTLTLNANGSFTYTPNRGFTGVDTFTYRATDGATDSPAATVRVTVLPAPTVLSVVFNDGSAQRSLVRSITVTFDTLVTLDAGAFRVARYGGGVPTQTWTVTNENGRTKVVITFRGGATQYGSLIDGNWVLRVYGARIHLADDPTVVMGADHVTKFHRFFGDSDGDRDVDAADKAAFIAALGRTDAASLATFDFDNDGDVDPFDRTKFNGRYGKRI